ncbi:MAG: hypothetical protein IBJ00_06475 [Alphaproteobacteria bacterium]|nr:hypothetical protein [Alphaproteobacteria bacterium]
MKTLPLLNAIFTISILIGPSFYTSHASPSDPPENVREDHIRKSSSNDLLTQEELSLIEESSKRPSSLQFLDLSNLGINSQNALRVSMCLRDSLGNINAINFSHNEIDDLVAWTLSKTCFFHPEVTALNFSHNKIKERGVAYLSDLSWLKSLDLSYNELSYKDIKSLNKNKLSSLTSLNLKGNFIEDTALKSLEEEFGCLSFSQNAMEVHIEEEGSTQPQFKEEISLPHESSSTEKIIDLDYSQRIEALRKQLDENKLEAVSELMALYTEAGSKLKKHLSDREIRALHSKAGKIFMLSYAPANTSSTKNPDSVLIHYEAFESCLPHALGKAG